MPPPDLAGRLFELAHLEGSFTLRSGLTTETYFDKFQFAADPDSLQAIVSGLVPLIPPETELLAGLELGGVPIAAALSLTTGIPVVFVRKQPKTYGTAKLAEGPSIEDKNLLIVEDIVTTGGQIVASVTALRKLGASINAAVSVVEREQGGVENLAAVGVKLRALFTRSDLEGAASTAEPTLQTTSDDV